VSSAAPKQVLDQFEAIMPAFADRWQSTDNLNRQEDGIFSLCGVFAECSHFVRDHFQQLSDSQLLQLGEFITRCMTPPGTELDNAAATCFLENLAFEPFSKEFEKYLAGKALEFYRRFQGA
jgi:hypothetical protein